MLKVPSTISKIVTLADNTVRLQVDCQELTPENEAEIFKLRNQLGYFVFSVSQAITEADIPTEKLERDEKSPSQRMRAVLYRLWEKEVTDPKKMDFELFYRTRLERLIEAIKDKLD